jgi:hypothetical protein
MDPDAVQTLFGLVNALFTVIDFALLVVAVVVAAVCTRRRLCPAAAWVLAAASAGLFATGFVRWLVEFGAREFINRFGAVGFGWVELGLALAEIALTLLFAGGLLMFRPAPAGAPGAEVAHG